MTTKKKKATRPVYKLGVGKGRFRKAIISALLEDWWEEDALDFGKSVFKNKCVYCGETKKLQGDHLVPEENGGAYCKGNIVPACGPCNHERNKKAWREFLLGKFTEINLSRKKAQKQIREIEKYLRDHNQDETMTLEKRIGAEKNNFVNQATGLFTAVVEGVRVYINKPKQKNKVFANPADLLTRLLKISSTAKRS